jgi:hypothetical protein
METTHTALPTLGHHLFLGVHFHVLELHANGCLYFQARFDFPQALLVQRMLPLGFQLGKSIVHFGHGGGRTTLSKPLATAHFWGMGSIVPVRYVGENGTISTRPIVKIMHELWKPVVQQAENVFLGAHVPDVTTHHDQDSQRGPGTVQPTSTTHPARSVSYKMTSNTAAAT